LTGEPAPRESLQALSNMRGYAICTEQRSGSSYLCQVLASTGVLGQPLEYFNGRGMASFRPAYPQDADGQLREILRQGATENGVYGVKLFSADYDRLAKGGLQRLPNLRFISLVRRDLLGQAISVTRLVQTNQSHADAAPMGEPAYDPVHIKREIHRLAWGQARWAAFFARCGIVPLYLEYDEISSHPQETADKVARLIGLGEGAQVYTRVQRDAISEEWRARFIAGSHDPSFLDKPLPPSYVSRAIRKFGTMLRRAAK
jgi:LPS sulfotransferase NodH